MECMMSSPGYVSGTTLSGKPTLKDTKYTISIQVHVKEGCHAKLTDIAGQEHLSS